MFSIGILSYKRTDLLLQTVKDLLKVRSNINLIILNNNENFCIKQEILDVIGDHEYINLSYIHDNENYGVALGRKIIVDKCVTSHLIMLDDDVEVPDINKIIESCTMEFKNNKDCKAIAFNIVEHTTGLHNRYEIPHKNKSINMDERFDTYIMIGAGHAFDVEIVRGVGNYPCDFGLYGFEEIDLSFRIINAGYSISYIPTCLIKHKKSPDGRFSNVTVNKLALINRSIMAKRYFSKINFAVCLLVRGGFFLLKTREFKQLCSAIKHILSDREKNKFGKDFHNYIKKVDGFIWW